MLSIKSLDSISRMIHGSRMRNWLYIAAFALSLHGCGQGTPADHGVQTQFSPSSGLTVTRNDGKSQQLIADSMDARAVVSSSAHWIAVEDMRMSNLVVVRLFHGHDDTYVEVALPEIRGHWEYLAQEAGITFEDLVRPRVTIESFGPDEGVLLVRFQAEVEPLGDKDIDALLEISLQRNLE
jgi:hypothetical protein